MGDLTVDLAFLWAKVWDFGLSPDSSQKVKWFRWAKDFDQIYGQTKVKLNFGLSPDFSVQLEVSLSERPGERLSQKLSHPVLQGVVK